MSLPIFDSQGSLFGNITSLAPGLFSEADRYKLFAQKIWPILAGTRGHLELGSISICLAKSLWVAPGAREPSLRAFRLRKTDAARSFLR